jgi:hypothetical protein
MDDPDSSNYLVQDLEGQMQLPREVANEAENKTPTGFQEDPRPNMAVGRRITLLDQVDPGRFIGCLEDRAAMGRNVEAL